jgi:hypothetical protein
MIKRLSEKQDINNRKLNVVLYGLEESQVEDYVRIASNIISLINTEIVRFKSSRIKTTKLIKIFVCQ